MHRIQRCIDASGRVPAASATGGTVAEVAARQTRGGGTGTNSVRIWPVR